MDLAPGKRPTYPRGPTHPQGSLPIDTYPLARVTTRLDLDPGKRPLHHFSIAGLNFMNLKKEKIEMEAHQITQTR